jgi:hypothetical protein
MQWGCKHAFPTIERLCFLRGPCKVVIKKSSVEKKGVKLQDASLPRYELGNREIELSQVFRIGICRIIVKKWQERNHGVQRRLHV